MGLPSRLAFDEFELMLDSGELFREGSLVTQLQPQPAKLLELLASRSGKVVGREEIRQARLGGGVRRLRRQPQLLRQAAPPGARRLRHLAALYRDPPPSGVSLPAAGPEHEGPPRGCPGNETPPVASLDSPSAHGAMAAAHRPRGHRRHGDPAAPADRQPFRFPAPSTPAQYLSSHRPGQKRGRPADPRRDHRRAHGRDRAAVLPAGARGGRSHLVPGLPGEREERPGDREEAGSDPSADGHRADVRRTAPHHRTAGEDLRQDPLGGELRRRADGRSGGLRPDLSTGGEDFERFATGGGCGGPSSGHPRRRSRPICRRSTCGTSGNSTRRRKRPKKRSLSRRTMRRPMRSSLSRGRTASFRRRKTLPPAGRRHSGPSSSIPSFPRLTWRWRTSCSRTSWIGRGLESSFSRPWCSAPAAPRSSTTMPVSDRSREERRGPRDGEPGSRARSGLHFITSDYAWFLFMARHTDEAIRQARNTLALIKMTQASIPPAIAVSAAAGRITSCFRFTAGATSTPPSPMGWSGCGTTVMTPIRRRFDR